MESSYNKPNVTIKLVLVQINKIIMIITCDLNIDKK